MYFPYFSVTTTFDDAFTRARLKPAGISAAPLRDYMGRLLDYATWSRWGKRPIARAEALAAASEAPPSPGGCPRRRVAPTPGREHARSVALLADTARFRTDDPDALVRASLACPICLCSDELEWHAALDGYDPSVECRCPRCEEHGGCTWSRSRRCGSR